MSLLPCLLPAADRVTGAPPGSFGDPLLDAYLEFLVARVRPNSVLAAWYDLKVFFGVVGKPVVAVTPADVFGRGELLADPIPDTVAALLAAAGGTIRMATIAPELPGAMDAIQVMLANGCLPAIGHTAASYNITKAAIEVGATGVTHIFNAMSPLGHRDPGPILAFLDDSRTTVELIFDGIHVSPALAAYMMRLLPNRVVLITDAMAAAGAPDGDYQLGALPVEVSDRVARLTGLDTIAGSTLTLDRAVRNAVAYGIPLAQAVRSATILPAEYPQPPQRRKSRSRSQSRPGRPRRRRERHQGHVRRNLAVAAHRHGTPARLTSIDSTRLEFTSTVFDVSSRGNHGQYPSFRASVVLQHRGVW